MINGKLRTQSKCDAVYKYILNVYVEPLHLKEKFSINTSEDLDNHWLAGFLDADGSFQVKCLERVNVTKTLLGSSSFSSAGRSTCFEIQLNMQIKHKTRLLLDLIKDKLGGCISYNKIHDEYEYNSLTYGSARKIILYLDYFHLLSKRHIDYLRFRKSYRRVQEKRYSDVVKYSKFLKSSGYNSQFTLAPFKLDINSVSRKGLSTLGKPKDLDLQVVNNSYSEINIAMDPYFLTGLVDGEGSFSISVIKSKNYKIGWLTQACFSISLHNKDISTLAKVKSTLGVGEMHKERENTVQYRVWSIKDLLIIIRHFVRS